MVDKIPVPELCNELEHKPSVFYQRRRQALENLAAASATPSPRGVLSDN